MQVPYPLLWRKGDLIFTEEAVNFPSKKRQREGKGAKNLLLLLQNRAREIGNRENFLFGGGVQLPQLCILQPNRSFIHLGTFRRKGYASQCPYQSTMQASTNTYK